MDLIKAAGIYGRFNAKRCKEELDENQSDR